MRTYFRVIGQLKDRELVRFSIGQALVFLIAAYAIDLACYLGRHVRVSWHEPPAAVAPAEPSRN